MKTQPKFNAWVQYKDADGVARTYNTPCRLITNLARRIKYLARKKPTNRANYATEITIKIARP